jgi:anti-sigma B factor antagonist
VSAAPAPPFEVSLEYASQDARLELRGELDMYSAPLLARELACAARERPRRIVLDLAHLHFMDVSGLRAILDAARGMRRHGGCIAIANPMPHIIRLFELTAIDQSVEVLGRPLTRVS